MSDAANSIAALFYNALQECEPSPVWWPDAMDSETGPFIEAARTVLLSRIPVELRTAVGNIDILTGKNPAHWLKIRSHGGLLDEAELVVGGSVLNLLELGIQDLGLHIDGRSAPLLTFTMRLR